MPVFILLGWIVGTSLAAVIGVAGLVALGIPVATLLATLVGSPLAALLPLLAPIITMLGPIGVALAALLAGVTALLVILLILVAIFVAYFVAFLVGYMIATAGVAGSFPAGHHLSAPTDCFLRAATERRADADHSHAERVFRPRLADRAQRRLQLRSAHAALGLRSGLGAGRRHLGVHAHFALGGHLPGTQRVFQGFLGWSAWLFPLAYLGTFPGLLLFLFNGIASRFAPPLPTLAPLTVALDFTTGVIESDEGFITRMSGFRGGFTQGNFTFLFRTAPPAAFTASSISTHEIGHSLNTAAMGGIVLWINAVDENLVPFRRLDLAYGELMAESHARLFGTTRVRFFVNQWF
jgi:hypothetical protein